jgi:hypothetical protein
MKMEDAQARRKQKRAEASGSDVESVMSGTDVDLANQDYEKMLVKYEASVRNHIKIEQQLKLHIECVQDKLDENEKNMGKHNAERENEKTEQLQLLARQKEANTTRDNKIKQLQNALDAKIQEDATQAKKIY